MDPTGATQVAGAAGSAAKELAKGLASAVLFGSFNPEYSKDDQKRMRYIQVKYAQAYGTKGAEDPETVIKTIDPNSRLLMTAAGKKPSNPFPHERAFEESLQMVFHPIPGHEGRFAASHAVSCIGKITEYQVQRRKRTWVPGVQTPGRPNDYINLFLEEAKTWLRTQMTLNVVVAEELTRREVYLAKLKHDNYYWCFPIEKSKDYAIHDVIDFVHNKVLDALEVVQREEKNKSLQTLFKDLNDHTTNAFEYGKNFLAYLLTATKKAGADLTSSNRFDGDTYETGRLHRLLERNTDPVMKMYVADIRESDRRIEAAATPQGPAGLLTPAQEAPIFYKIIVLKIEDGGLFGPATFVFSVTDPKANTWVLRKKYADFEVVLKEACLCVDKPEELRLAFPPSRSGIMKPTTEELQARGEGLIEFMVKLLEAAPEMQEKGRRLMCEFFDVKALYDPPTKLIHAETIPNTFVELKKQFLDMIASQDKKNIKEGDRMFGVLKQAWGIDVTARILEAHALLQRLATLLGLTLEINHFFVSMFGNTLAFSKLPLRDLLMTLKDILGNFLALASDLFKYACQLNADQKYNWHKNLQATENELSMVRHHTERALGVIAKIDGDHLDYEAQLRRLQDVTQRFAPLLCRLDNSLPMIQAELNLPTRLDMLTDGSNNSRPAPIMPFLPGPRIEQVVTPISASSRFEEVEESNENAALSPTAPSISSAASTPHAPPARQDAPMSLSSSMKKNAPTPSSSNHANARGPMVQESPPTANASSTPSSVPSQPLPQQAPVSAPSRPVAQQPVAQQPLPQQPVAQQPVAQQPLPQQTMAQPPVSAAGGVPKADPTQEAMTGQGIGEGGPVVVKHKAPLCSSSGMCIAM